MSDTLPKTTAQYAKDRYSRLERLCSKFESAWQAGTPTGLLQYFADVPADEHAELLRELLSLDEHYRRQSDEAIEEAAYIAQFPDHAETIRGYFAAQSTTPESARSLPQVPGYFVERELGRGGMGVVYLAEQARPRRHVVIKMIRDGALAHPDQLRRFHTESEAIARLQHPNILQVYAVGDHDGRPYMVLEYVEGGGLDRRLNGKPMADRDAAKLIEQLAKAVHYAHQQGVIHRDLKPANILIAEYGAPAGAVLPRDRQSKVSYPHFAIPKIADFGLAKLLEDEAGSHTLTGDTLGTPSYMAPEQARGDSPAIGPATDVYALGALLYQLLTGRAPFVGPNAVTTLEQVTGHDPVPPRQLQPQVARDLNTICLKCLEKAPKKRYGSAEALAEDLRRFQAGEPIRARAVSAPERLIRWARRYPAAAGLLAALLIGLATTTGLLLRLELAQKNERLAKAKSDASLEHAQESVRKALVFLIDDDEMTKKGLFELRLRVLSAITEQAESIRVQNADPKLMAYELAKAHMAIGTLQQHLGQLTNPVESLDKAISLFGMLADSEPSSIDFRIQLASALTNKGIYFGNQMRQDLARPLMEKAIEIYRNIIRDHPLEAIAQVKLADALYQFAQQSQWTKRNAEAAAIYEQALAPAAESVRLQPGQPLPQVNRARLLSVMAGNASFIEHDSVLEIGRVREAGAILNSVTDAQSDDIELRTLLATCLNNVGWIANKYKLYAESESYHRRASAILERLCQDFPESQTYRFGMIDTNALLSRLYRQIGQLDKQDAASRQILAQIEQLLKSGPTKLSLQMRTMILTELHWHVEYLIRQKKLDEAIECILRAENLTAVIMGPGQQVDRQARELAKSMEPKWRCQFAILRAIALDADHRYGESIAVWDQSWRMHEEFRTRQRVGRALALAGAGDSAAALAEAQAAEPATDLTGNNLYDLARTYARCCLTDTSGARADKAIEYLHKALAKKFFQFPDEVNLLTADPDLTPIRGRPDFAALIEAIQKAQSK